MEQRRRGLGARLAAGRQRVVDALEDVGHGDGDGSERPARRVETAPTGATPVVVREQPMMYSRTAAGLVAADVDTGAAATDDELRADPVRSVPWGLRATAAWAWRFLVICAAVAIIGWIAIQLQTIVIALLATLLVAALLVPLTSFLRRRWKFPPALAALTPIVLVFAVVGGLLTVAGQGIASGFQELVERAAAGFNDVLEWLSTGPLAVNESAINNAVDQIQSQVRANASTLASGVVSVTSSAAEVLAGFFIGVFLLFFFLKDGDTIWGWLVRLAPRRARPTVDEAGRRAWHTVNGYTRTQIIIALVDAVLIGAGAAILQVPLAFAIGILVFVGAFIPIVGAFISGAVAVLVALVDQGFSTAVIMLAIVLVVQFLEGNLLQPVLQSRAVKLHPIVVLLAVTAGTAVAGIFGALFAVPIVAAINEVGMYLANRRSDPQAPGEDESQVGDPAASPDAAPADTADTDTAPDAEARESPPFGSSVVAPEGGAR